MSCEQRLVWCVQVSLRENNTYEIVGEWRDLLNTADSDVVVALLLALLKERVVDLAGTQDVAADVFGRDQLLWFRDVALEVGVANHLRKVGAGLRVTEKGLREEDNKRLAVVTMDLATKDVEVVGRCPESQRRQ